jgi:serine acetyltransferase
MREKLGKFWRAPLFTKAHWIGTVYYRAKGALVYRHFFARFGKGSLIRKPLLILNPAHIWIGDRVSIRQGARLEVIRTSERRIPELRVGDDTSMEQNAHICCHNRVVIGNRVAISANCCILDVQHPYLDVNDPLKILDRVADDDASVEIGDDSLLGYGSVILPNVVIGRNVVIGSNSVVASDIPDFCVAAGNPAKVIKRYDSSIGSWIRVRDNSLAAV